MPSRSAHSSCDAPKTSTPTRRAKNAGVTQRGFSSSHAPATLGAIALCLSVSISVDRKISAMKSPMTMASTTAKTARAIPRSNPSTRAV